MIVLDILGYFNTKYLVVGLEFVHDFNPHLATFVSAAVPVDVNSNVLLQPAHILHPDIG